MYKYITFTLKNWICRHKQVLPQFMLCISYNYLLQMFHKNLEKHIGAEKTILLFQNWLQAIETFIGDLLVLQSFADINDSTTIIDCPSGSCRARLSRSSCTSSSSQQFLNLNLMVRLMCRLASFIFLWPSRL